MLVVNSKDNGSKQKKIVLPFLSMLVLIVSVLRSFTH